MTSLTDGQRDYDLDIAVTNITGELLDLQASEDLDEAIDPFEIGERIRKRYTDLWSALTETETIESNVPYEVSQRVRALNDMGFDVGEIDMEQTSDGTAVRIRPKVVDAGHHSRRLLRLTGLDVQENQARRLLNDVDEYRTIHADEYASYRADDLDPETFAAHRWLTHIFEPTVKAVPRDLRGKLEPAQIFHEIMEHRWYLAESAGHDVPMPVATASYVKNVLPTKADEKAILGRSLAEMTAELPALTAEVGTVYGQTRDAYENDNTHGWGGMPEPEDEEPRGGAAHQHAHPGHVKAQGASRPRGGRVATCPIPHHGSAVARRAIFLDFDGTYAHHGVVPAGPRRGRGSRPFPWPRGVPVHGTAAVLAARRDPGVRL